MPSLVLRAAPLNRKEFDIRMTLRCTAAWAAKMPAWSWVTRKRKASSFCEHGTLRVLVPNQLLSPPSYLRMTCLIHYPMWPAWSSLFGFSSSRVPRFQDVPSPTSASKARFRSSALQLLAAPSESPKDKSIAIFSSRYVCHVSWDSFFGEQ